MQSNAQIDQVLRQKSDAKEIPGVVAMAATAKEVTYQGAFGKRDLSKDDAITADSVFWIASMTKAVTVAGAMQLVEQGKLSLEPIPFELEQDPEFHMGGGGLYSTAGDYIRFTQMILNKGRGNGNQVLKAETVATMGQNHMGDLNVTKMISALPDFTNDIDLYPDMAKKWGLSFLINTAKTPEGRSPGSLAWAGLANTYYWIDPARDVTGVILMQVLPFGDNRCLEAFAGFESGVYAGLDAAQQAA